MGGLIVTLAIMGTTALLMCAVHKHDTGLRKADFMNEFYNKVMSHDKIYSLLYSPQRTSDPIENQIVELQTSRLRWNNEKDEFVYVWGFPGPDYNLYTRNTYGKGWAFSKEEIMEAWMKG